MSDDVLLERRREINRRAATKSRRKQREKAVSVKQKYHEELSQNTKLNYERTVLLKEVDFLREQLRDHKKICSNPGSLPKPTVTPVYVSSSDSSEEADLMGYSCESRDGNESDVSGIYPEQTILRGKGVDASSVTTSSSLRNITLGIKGVAEETYNLNEEDGAQEDPNFWVKTGSPSGLIFSRSISCPCPNSQATGIFTSQQCSSSLASRRNPSESSLTSSTLYLLESNIPASNIPASAGMFDAGFEEFGEDSNYRTDYEGCDDLLKYVSDFIYDSVEREQLDQSSVSFSNLEAGIEHRLKIESSDDKEECKIGSSMDYSSLESLIQNSEKRPVSKSDEGPIGEIERSLKDCENEIGTKSSDKRNEESLLIDNLPQLDIVTSLQSSDLLWQDVECSRDMFDASVFNVEDIVMQPISIGSRKYETRREGYEEISNPMNDETFCNESSEPALRGRGLSPGINAEYNDALFDTDTMGCFSSVFGTISEPLQASSYASTDSYNFVSKLEGFVDKPKTVESHILLQKMEDCSSKSIISDKLISPELNFRKTLEHFSGSNIREMERYGEDYETDHMIKQLIGHTTTPLIERTHGQLIDQANEQLVGRTHEQLIGRTKEKLITNSILSDSRQLANDYKRRHSSTSSIHDKGKFVRFSSSTYVTPPLLSTQESTRTTWSLNCDADVYRADYKPMYSDNFKELFTIGETRTRDADFRRKSYDMIYTSPHDVQAGTEERANKFQRRAADSRPTNIDFTDDKFVADPLTKIPNVAQFDEVSLHPRQLDQAILCGLRSPASRSESYLDRRDDRLIQPSDYASSIEQNRSNSNEGRHVVDRQLPPEKANSGQRRVIRQKSIESISNQPVPSSVATHMHGRYGNVMWQKPIHSRHRTYNSRALVAGGTGSSQNMSQFSPGIEGMPNRYDPMIQGLHPLSTVCMTETAETQIPKRQPFDRSDMLKAATKDPRRITRGMSHESHPARGYCRSDPSIFLSSFMQPEDEEESFLSSRHRKLFRGSDESVASADGMIQKDWESLLYNSNKNDPAEDPPMEGPLDVYRQAAARTNRKSFSMRRLPDVLAHKTHVTKLSKNFRPSHYESIPEMETTLTDKSHYDPSYPSGSDNSQTHDPYYTWSPSTARRERTGFLHHSHSDFDCFSDRSMVPTCTGSMDLDDLNYLSPNDSNLFNSDLVNR